MSDTATAAKATLSLIETALKVDLASDLAQPGWEDTRTLFRETFLLLLHAGAITKTADSWRFFPEALDGRNDDILAPIGAAGLSIAEALATPERVEALSSNGKLSLLKAAVVAADAQAVAAGTPVDLDVLRAAVAPTLPSAEHLHAVTIASLELLDTFERTSAFLPNTYDGQRALELHKRLASALRYDDLAPPGENLEHTASPTTQTLPSDRTQQMAIFNAAGAYADHLRATGLIEEIKILDEPLARIDLIRKIQNLDIALQNARSETPVALETPDTALTAHSPITQIQAKAILGAVDLGNSIAVSAQFDTQPEMSMFPREHLKTLNNVLSTIDQVSADLALNAARKNDQPLPGVSDDALKTIGELVQELRDVRLNAQPRGEDFVAIPQEDVDRITRFTDRILYSGAREGLAAIAGESETPSFLMTEGRDSAAFATLQDAMHGGARPDNPEKAIDTIRPILPEMSLSEWNSFSPHRRSTIQAVFIEPGKGDFVGLNIASDLGSFFDPRLREAQEKTLRTFIRRQVLDETPLENGKGTVGERFRDRILNARHRIIVAPTRGLAKVYREEGDRIADELIRQKRESAEIALSNLERIPADFNRSQVAHFLHIVEAQGTPSAASLIKTGDHLIMTHPNGPTLTPDISSLGSLAHHPDGHVIAKIPIESLRGAVETGQPKVRLVVTEDRVAAIIGYTPTAKRSRSQGTTEIAA